MTENRLPAGMYFDGYLGEGLGALRSEAAGLKIADEIDEAEAHRIAWALVEPELAEIRAQRDASDRKLTDMLTAITRERDHLRGELTAAEAERDHLRDVALPEHRERIAELEHERDASDRKLLEISSEFGRFIRTRPAVAVAIHERDDALARAEQAERERDEARAGADELRSRIDRLCNDALDELGRFGADYFAGKATGLGETRRPIARRAWQRKPVTHEWGYADHYERAGELVGWTIGEGGVVDGEWCMAMSRPIEPTEASKRKHIGDLHPDGCFAPAGSIPVLRDCWGDGHYMCRHCVRYERAPAGYEASERGDA